MTTSTQSMTVADAIEQITAGVRPTDAGRGTVGLEIEWIVIDPVHPTRPVGAEEVLAAADGPLPREGALTVEPGGQLELSTTRQPEAWSALDAAAADEAVLQRRMTRAGLRLLATGLDPFRPPVRSLDLPRYRAMAAAFEGRWPAGTVMMCSTASLQVNVDFGAVPADTWQRAAWVAPVLAAAFANSPGPAMDGTPAASARSTVWTMIDPSRTAPVSGPTSTSTANGAALGWEHEWAEYALEANVVFIRTGDDVEAVTEPFTLRQWITQGHRIGFPGPSDVTEHLTTLWPPVRPRQWLECRFFDALPPVDRTVAVLALVALVSDGAPIDEIRRACSGIDDPWSLVASGTASAPMARAGERCLDLACHLLDAERPGSSIPVRSWTSRRASAGWVPDTTAPDLQSLDRIEQEIT
ncbi:MAG: glutamate-cysteine ligase family protein [Acidimicrobiales bacterium]